MNPTEKVVRDFVGFLQCQSCNHMTHYEENVCLRAWEITNNSSNDYLRLPKDEEIEKLIARFMENRAEPETETEDDDGQGTYSWLGK